MTYHAYAAVTLALISVTMPLRAANRPHAGTDSPDKKVWTNDDLEKLHRVGLISIVGRTDEERPTSASAPGPYVETQDRQWYAEQATNLHDEVEGRQAQLYEYRQALEDARSLRNTTGGINLAEGDVGITPESAIEILEQRVNETQTDLDELGDLARRNDIPPGTLRGQ